MSEENKKMRGQVQKIGKGIKANYDPAKDEYVLLQ
jgi:hypothetical protein